VAVAISDPDEQRAGSDGLVAALMRQEEPGTATTTSGGRSRFLPTPFAQFAVIRSVAVKMGDYGSGGRGFESLPARFSRTAPYVPVAGRFRVFGRSRRRVIHRASSLNQRIILPSSFDGGPADCLRRQLARHGRLVADFPKQRERSSRVEDRGGAGEQLSREEAGPVEDGTLHDWQRHLCC